VVLFVFLVCLGESCVFLVLGLKGFGTQEKCYTISYNDIDIAAHIDGNFYNLW
jgi:hypothetical protein